VTETPTVEVSTATIYSEVRWAWITRNNDFNSNCNTNSTPNPSYWARILYWNYNSLLVVQPNNYNWGKDSHCLHFSFKASEQTETYTVTVTPSWSSSSRAVTRTRTITVVPTLETDSYTITVTPSWTSKPNVETLTRDVTVTPVTVQETYTETVTPKGHSCPITFTQDYYCYWDSTGRVWNLHARLLHLRGLVSQSLLSRLQPSLRSQNKRLTLILRPWLPQVNHHLLK
jgi:hypothetical protein